MRVLIISHMYPNLMTPLRGIFVQKQAEALVQQGLDVTMIAPVSHAPALLKQSSRWGGYRAIPFKEQHAGFEVFHPRVWEFPRNFLFEYAPAFYERGLRSLVLEQAAKGVDLIHAHVAHPDGAVAVRLGRQLGLPVVVTIHGQDFAYTLKRSKTCARSVRQTLQQANRVILVSEKLKTHYGLETWADDLSKYKIIYNGMHLTEVVEADNNQANPGNTTYGTKGKVILSVGFLRKPKGHADVLHAMPKLLEEFPDLQYRIVGDGAERDNLQALTRTLALEEHVQFLGSLPHAQAMLEMSKCDVFVLPSWNEAFGVVYLEAMAHGKPIIGTLGEGIAEILTQEDVGIAVPPRDPQTLATALGKLLRDPEKAGQKGGRGRELVRSKFTWEYNAKRTIQTYQEVLDELKGEQRGDSFSC